MRTPKEILREKKRKKALKTSQNNDELLDNETEEDIPEIEAEEYQPRFCKKCKCELTSNSKHLLCENCRSEMFDKAKTGGKIVLGLGATLLLFLGKGLISPDSDDIEKDV